MTPAEIRAELVRAFGENSSMVKEFDLLQAKSKNSI